MRPGTHSPAPPPQPGDWLGAQPALDILGGKWTLPVMDAIQQGPRRHRDLADTLRPRVSNKVLTATLRRLLRDELIVRHNAEDGTVTYTLSPLGQSLHPHIAALSNWSHRHRNQLPQNN